MNFVLRKNLYAMGTFGIYAAVLTFLLFLCYAVLICLDLFKKDGQKKETVESFDVSDMEEDVGVSVHETSDGDFVLGDENLPEEEDLTQEFWNGIADTPESYMGTSSEAGQGDGGDSSFASSEGYTDFSSDDEDSSDSGAGGDEGHDDGSQDVERMYQQELPSAACIEMMENWDDEDIRKSNIYLERLPAEE